MLSAVLVQHPAILASCCFSRSVLLAILYDLHMMFADSVLSRQHGKEADRSSFHYPDRSQFNGLEKSNLQGYSCHGKCLKDIRVRQQ